MTQPWSSGARGWHPGRQRGPRAIRDATLKSRLLRHESTMTIDGGFVADESQSFFLTMAAGIGVFCDRHVAVR